MGFENESSHEQENDLPKSEKNKTPEKLKTPENEKAFAVTLCVKRPGEDYMMSSKYFFSFAFKETISGLSPIDERDLPEKNENETEDEYLARIIEDPKVIKMAEHVVSEWGNPPVIMYTR
jgi:hypothetical protein